MFKHICFVSLMLCAASSALFADERAGKPSNEEFMQKAQKIQMPFIANEGQADERVKYYAKTFGGTVYVQRKAGSSICCRSAKKALRKTAIAEMEAKGLVICHIRALKERHPFFQLINGFRV